MNLAGVSGVTARASGQGTLQLRWNSATATPFASVAVNSGGWGDTSTTFSNAPTGTGVLYVTSTGGVVLDRLTFVGDGVADVTPPTVSVTLDPAQPTGENGWWLGNVVARLTATDNGTVSTRQFSTNGGQTWTTVSANNPTTTVSAEGSTTLLYRATDNGGNVGQGSVVVKIDKSAPTLAVSGATDGGSVGNSGDITWTAADAVSGVQSVTATVDGQAVAADKPLALWGLSLGQHTLVVTVEDNAGRTASQSLTFTTTTSLAELTKLTARFAASGEVTKSGASALGKRLEQAKKHADGGRTQAAVSQLEGFIGALGDRTLVTDAAAAAALERDAREVIRQLRG